jgi:dolichol-phosphate mannosyltransferase
MSVQTDISLVIPCFNEADNVETIAVELRPVVAQLRAERTVELIFVDDGSTDGTGDLLEALLRDDPAARVIRHDRNRGLGAALRTGFGQASGAIIVTTDSDATYPFSLIPSLLDRLEPGVAVVTGSCYHPDGGVADVPGYRVFLSRSASLMYRLLLDPGIHTYTCLFRAYRGEVVRTAPFHADGFLGVTELLANAVLAGYTVRELPCTLRVRRYGQSKAKVARIILAHLRFQWGIVRRRGIRLRRTVGARPPVNAHGVQPSPRS